MLALLKRYDYLLVFFFFFSFFVMTINNQKLEFYNLQNAIVESLVERHAFAMRGISAGDNDWYFENVDTQTPQLRFVGDVYPYKGLWYPAKSYGPHYVAAIIYVYLKLFGLSFANNYHLVSSLLLMFTSILMATIGITLTYIVAKKITSDSLKALIVTFSVGFGSLLTGAINVRNEETFGYWLYIFIYMLTFLELKNKWWPLILTILLYYAVFSLPILILLTPLALYRIYLLCNKQQRFMFIVTNIACIVAITFHNYLIFGRLVFSNYTIGEELNPGYHLGQLTLSLPNWLEKIQFYFLNWDTSIVTNYPLIIPALLGIGVSSLSWRTKSITILTCILFALYMTNIGELTGWVGYGSGRYMAGIFPVSYIYLSYLLKKPYPLVWIGIAITEIISINTGFFFYFSPIRNVFDKSTEVFGNLFLQDKLFLIISCIIVIGLFAPLFHNKLYLKKGG